jgi:hypothetical protein
MTPIALQTWIKDDLPKDDMLWKGSCEQQLLFVRDVLTNVLFSTYEESDKYPIMVISTHRSKSIVLPVYQVTLPNGLVATMRDNFHDWKVSISSPQELRLNPNRLFKPQAAISHCYFEGFPDDLIYGSYDSNHKQFSVELFSKYTLYCFFWQICYGQG